jgi:hypothetical protein
MNKFIVSGIGPSNGGVGRLMYSLSEMGREKGYQIITKRNEVSLKKLFKDRMIIRLLMEPIIRLGASILFSFKVASLKHSVILFVHPQFAGYPLLFRLLKSRNKVFLYVMDNSFFCIESYNYDRLNKHECLKCVASINSCYDFCKPFPNKKLSKSTNLNYLKILREMNHKIIFLAQNENQKKLISEHFGIDCKVKVVGMDTGEFSGPNVGYEKKETIKYDIVFHGSTVYAKGIEFFVDLSINLPEFIFFVPDSKANVERLLAQKISNKNIHFVDCNWETGLKSIVTNASLVLVPSLWSAPIEGALIKSILINGNVGVIKSLYGYASEIAQEAQLLVLENNIKNASKKIQQFLSKKNYSTIKQKEWTAEFLRTNNLNNLFNLIDIEVRLNP